MPIQILSCNAHDSPKVRVLVLLGCHNRPSSLELRLCACGRTLLLWLLPLRIIACWLGSLRASTLRFYNLIFCHLFYHLNKLRTPGLGLSFPVHGTKKISEFYIPKYSCQATSCHEEFRTQESLRRPAFFVFLPKHRRKFQAGALTTRPSRQTISFSKKNNLYQKKIPRKTSFLGSS